MILQTGGSALATISTRSRSESSAARNASVNETILFVLHLQLRGVLLSHGSRH
jgi:hypothetical protein